MMHSELNRFAVSSHFLSPFPKSFSLRKKVPWWYQILDPRSKFIARWNRTFLYSCIAALFLDPLYFYFPITGDKACMQTDLVLGVFVTFFRTVADLFFLFHMVLKFRTAFVSPTSRVYGRKELVTDPRQIASRYLKSDFIVDLLATLPLPQIVIWFVVPAVKNSTAAHANHTLSLIVLIQYIPRLFQIFPLQRRILKTSGLIAKTALAGALYNLGFYMLASHVLGASWYVSSIQRQYECWRITCKKEMNRTHTLLLVILRFWIVLPSTTTNAKLGLNAQEFLLIVMLSIVKTTFSLDCSLMLLLITSYGQNLQTSTYSGETLFQVSFALQALSCLRISLNYLQSSTARLEEWRLKQKDTEEWMNHRQLPPELQERVRRFVQYKWLTTRGVDEEAILRALPLDLRRQIQRHLCLDIVRRIRIFNSITLRPGDFCGEELLTWALMPTSSLNLPSSTRTVKTLTEVEAFALRAEDLKFVSNQFKRLHSKKLQHAFRYYSHQWRAWGACFIQAAWRRHRKRKLAMELLEKENLYYSNVMELEDDEEISAAESSTGDSASHIQNLGATVLASKFAANTRKGAVKKVTIPDASSLKMPKMFKPTEPDFSTFHED
ncbi:RmlC-like jelly roll fold [Sesbania bispinosa]|nr:RmlC-like jelly roll fold [Sesbania bispinosa]